MISDDLAIKIAYLAGLETGEEAISYNADGYIIVGCWGRKDYHNEVGIDFTIEGKVIVSRSSPNGNEVVRSQEKIKELMLSECSLEIEFYKEPEDFNPYLSNS